MNQNHNELKVGIAVLISLVMLVGGIIWGKGYSVNARRYTIQVEFKNIGGLSIGTDVLANGVKSGRVRDVKLLEGRVIVEADIEKNVSIFSDYKITIESPTLMAGKILAIYPGGTLPKADISVPLKGDEPLGVGEAVAMVQSLATDIKVTLQRVNTLLVSLDEIAGDSANQKNLAGLLKNASEMTQTANVWLHDNRASMTDILDKLESTLVSMDKVVKSTEAQVGTTMTNFNSAALAIDSLSTTLHGMIQKLESGEGTMGKLLTDDELYLRLNTTLKNVDSLAVSIRTKGLRNKIVLF